MTFTTKKYTPLDLINFEQQVCDAWANKEIKSPVHLYYGNEESMINIFDKEHISDQDWVFCTWRSHYQCLLKGVPPDRLLNDIKNGRSISLCYPEYNIFSSAIVTGNIPIAMGVAFDLHRKTSSARVFCFVGDMTSETGCFDENYKYALNHGLPIKWIIEDNGKSVCTDTKKTWNYSIPSYRYRYNIISYKYESKFPHAGTGERITF